MEDRPSASQYYSSIRGEVEFERFQELIGEEIDRELLYVHDKKKSIVNVYRNNTGKAKPFWDIAYLLFCVIYIYLLFNTFKDNFTWSGISYDLSMVLLLTAVLLYYIVRRITYRSVKLEKLYEIKLDVKKSKDHIMSMRVFKIACGIFILFVFFFIGFWQSYSLTYLRYLAEGSSEVTTVQGEINGTHEFDEKTVEIPGSIEGIPGASEEIELYLSIDKCPNEVVIYINGEEVDAALECYRESGGLLSKSYFTNIIRATLVYKAEEINTLEVNAGSFDKVWTFILNGEKGGREHERETEFLGFLSCIQKTNIPHRIRQLSCRAR